MDMAFFTGTEQEIYEHRLKRTASADRLHRRTRSRSATSSLTAPSPPSTHPQTPAHSSPTPPPQAQPSNTCLQASQEPAPVSRAKTKTPSPSRPSEASGPVSAPHAFPTSSQDASIQPQHVHHSSPSDSRAVPPPAPDPRDRMRDMSSTSGGSRLPLGPDASHPHPHPHRYYASSSSSVSLFSAPRPHISGNLSDAGTSSDRASSPLPATRLDVKRLLSKPAAPTYHRTSFVDLSDSEPLATKTAANGSLSPQPASRLPSPDNRAPRPQPTRETRSPVTPMHTPTSTPGRQMLLPKDAHTSSPESAADRITSPVPHPHPSLSPSPSCSPSIPSSPRPSPHTSPTTLSKTSFAIESKDSGERSKSRTGGLFRLRSRGTSGSGASGSPRSKTALAELLAAKDAQKRAETAAQKRGHNKINSDIPYDLSWGRWSPPTPTASTGLTRGSNSNSNSSSPAPSAVRERAETKHKLTPAGAIMQAYKQQDERREQLVASVQGGDPLPGSSASSASPSAVRTDSDRARAQASPMPFAKYARHVRPTPADSSKTETPYFTLFGSSGRVVATGTGEDASPSAKKWTRRATVSVASAGRSQQPQASASAPPTVRKALARKASGRLHRPRTAEQTDESPTRSEPEPSEPSADANRPSLQERRSLTLPKEGRKSLRLSIDDFVHIEPPEFLYPGRAATLPLPTSEPAGSPFERKMKSAKGKEREKEREEEGVSRLWKLVKRLSTNGLRDKYQPAPPVTPLPPVPAIPKDLLPLSNTCELEVHSPSPEMTSGGRASATGRFLDSRTSMSGVRPMTAPASPPPMPKRQLTGASSSKAGSSFNPSGSGSTRPSTSSSDLASARFFHRTSSPRSSSSSSFDEIPPVPDLSNRILSPTELKRFDEDEDDEARAVLFSPVPLASPEDEHERTGSPHALPLPPRRIQTADRRTYRRADPASTPSPDMPVFSIAGAVNNFVSRRPSRDEHSVSVKSASADASARSNAAPSPLSEFGQAEVGEREGQGAEQRHGPPPRPARSPHRPSPPNSSSASSSAEGSPTTGRVSSEPVTPVVTLAYSPSHTHSHSYSHSHSPSYRNRDSMGTHSDASTARPVSPAATTTGPAAPAHLTFRELDSEPKTLRTDQEKDRMWDDLMERSELAGGTLHLGEEDGLMSDRMRFSVSSVGSIT